MSEELNARLKWFQDALQKSQDQCVELRAQVLELERRLTEAKSANADEFLIRRNKERYRRPGVTA